MLNTDAEDVNEPVYTQPQPHPNVDHGGYVFFSVDELGFKLL